MGRGRRCGSLEWKGVVYICPQVLKMEKTDQTGV